jgi:hypothetical protein
MHDALATDYFPPLSRISIKWRLDNILIANQRQKHQSYRGGDLCCLDFAPPTLHRAYSKVASRRSFKIWAFTLSVSAYGAETLARIHL